MGSSGQAAGPAGGALATGPCARRSSSACFSRVAGGRATPLRRLRLTALDRSQRFGVFIQLLAATGVTPGAQPGSTLWLVPGAAVQDPAPRLVRYSSQRQGQSRGVRGPQCLLPLSQNIFFFNSN